MSKENGYTVKGNDHIRHIDKTRQDHQPVSERQRVKNWQKRQKRSDNLPTGNDYRPDPSDPITHEMETV